MHIFPDLLRFPVTHGQYKLHSPWQEISNLSKRILKLFYSIQKGKVDLITDTDCTPRRHGLLSNDAMPMFGSEQFRR